MARRSRQYGESLSVGSLHFNKKGSEIQAAVSSSLAEIQKSIGEHEKTITDIATKRDIDPKEIIAAGDDPYQVNTYTNKMSNAVGASMSAKVVNALQEDINTLKASGAAIARLKAKAFELELVKKHINPEITFVLKFEELLDLGFEP